MKTIDLNGLWVLQDCNGKCWNAHIPGSVYSTLLEKGAMDDPYYRDNELQALELMKQDYVFSRSFSCDPQWMGSTKLLRCEGLDTICTVQVNGQTVGKADNMHRIWEFDVTHAIKPGENTLSIQFESPIRWIKNALQKDFIGETTNRLSVVTEPSKIETSARLCVANETRVSGQVEVRWQLRNAAADILQEGSWSLEVPALSSVWCDKLDFDGTDFLENYFSYQLYRDGQCVSSGTVLFTAPKHYHFRNPNLTWKREGNSLTISADAFAKSVEISSPDCDLILSDNYFDLNAGSRSIEILEGDPQTITLKSVYDIR